MKCVVGLGNRGRKYAKTRHNVGYMVVAELARRMGTEFTESGFSDIAEGKIPGEPGIPVLLVKPATYMNSSGQAVLDILLHHPVVLSDMIVVHDDMDLPFGTIRLRRRGSSGGHKGVESIMASIETGDFIRLKVGIGRPAPGTDPVEHVLEPFTPWEAGLLAEVINGAAGAALDVFRHGLEWAMGEYNGKEPLDEGGDR
ncbi:MAG: aminoacyl-tRNA hydrolase [Bacillota bacterium]